MPTSKLESAFLAFHNKHPQVLPMLHLCALSRIRRGAKRLTIKALYEDIRSNFFPVGDNASPRLNNNHTPYYARLLLVQYPELSGYLVIKRQQEQCSFGPGNASLPSSEHVV